MSVEIVGIVDVTPESFSNDGPYRTPKDAIAHAAAMVTQGASMISISAESTQLGAEPISDDEEWGRLEPVLSQLPPEVAANISISTYHAATIENAVSLSNLDGSRKLNITVNDVTGGAHEDLVDIAAYYELPYIISHLSIEAEGDIQYAHDYLPADTDQVMSDLGRRARELTEIGIPREHIVIDPGLDYAKRPATSWDLLMRAGRMEPLDLPVMISYSRKRFLETYKDSGWPREGVDRKSIAVNLAAATILLNTIGRRKLYIRVHDVAEHVQLVDEHRGKSAPAKVPA